MDSDLDQGLTILDPPLSIVGDLGLKLGLDWDFGLRLVNILMFPFNQLGKTLIFVVRVIILLKMESKTWKIKGGKQNPEWKTLERRVQVILKPGDGQKGVAYQFNDAQVMYDVLIIPGLTHHNSAHCGLSFIQSDKYAAEYI